MNREVKFRAWENNLKEIIPVEEINFNSLMINQTTAWRFIDEVELMQYTGLKDKNGVEIYEGDIVEFNGLYEIKFGEHGVPNAETESYQDLATGFYFKAQHDLKDVEPFSFDIPLNKIYASECEVLDNVFENPELLERDEE